MTAGPVMARQAGAAEPLAQERLVPRDRGFDRNWERTAWWALNVSAARPVIAAVASGDAPANWVEALLAGVTIADIDENNLHFLGPLGGRARMIGAPFRLIARPRAGRPARNSFWRP